MGAIVPCYCSVCRRQVYFFGRQGGCCPIHDTGIFGCIRAPCTILPLFTDITPEQRKCLPAQGAICLQCAENASLEHSSLSTRALMQLALAGADDTQNDLQKTLSSLATSMTKGPHELHLYVATQRLLIAVETGESPVMSPLGDCEESWRLVGGDLRGRVGATFNVERHVGLLERDTELLSFNEHAADALWATLDMAPSVRAFIESQIPCDSPNASWRRLFYASMLLGFSGNTRLQELLWPSRALHRLALRPHCRMALHHLLRTFGVFGKSWGAKQLEDQSRYTDPTLEKKQARFESWCAGKPPNTFFTVLVDNIDKQSSSSSSRMAMKDTSSHQAHATFVAVVAVTPVGDNDDIPGEINIDGNGATPDDVFEAVNWTVGGNWPHPKRFLDDLLRDLSLESPDGSKKFVDKFFLPTPTYPPNSKQRLRSILCAISAFLKSSQTLCSRTNQVTLVIDGLIYSLFLKIMHEDLTRDVELQIFDIKFFTPTIGLFHLSAVLMEALMSISGPFCVYILSHMLGVLSGAKLDAMKGHRENRILCGAILQLLGLCLHRAHQEAGDGVHYDEWVKGSRLRRVFHAILKLFVVWMDVESCIRNGDSRALRSTLLNVLKIILADGHTTAAPLVAYAIAQLGDMPEALLHMLRLGDGYSCHYYPDSEFLVAWDERTEMFIRFIKAMYSHGVISDRQLALHVDWLGRRQQGGDAALTQSVVDKANYRTMGSRSRRRYTSRRVGAVEGRMETAVKAIVPLLIAVEGDDVPWSVEAAPRLHDDALVETLCSLLDSGRALDLGKRLLNDATRLHALVQGQPVAANDDPVVPLTAAGTGAGVFGAGIKATGAFAEKAAKKKKSKATTVALATNRRQRCANQAILLTLGGDGNVQQRLDAAEHLVVAQQGNPTEYSLMLTENGVDGNPLTATQKSKVVPVIFREILGVTVWPSPVSTTISIPGARSRSAAEQTVVVDDTTQGFYNKPKCSVRTLVWSCKNKVLTALYAGSSIVLVFDQHAEIGQLKGSTEQKRDEARAVDASQIEAEKAMVSATGDDFALSKVLCMDIYRSYRPLRGKLIRAIAKHVSEDPVVKRLLAENPGLAFVVAGLTDSEGVRCTLAFGSQLHAALQNVPISTHDEADQTIFVVLHHLLTSMPVAHVTGMSTDTDVGLRFLLFHAIHPTTKITWDTRTKLFLIDGLTLPDLPAHTSECEFLVSLVICAMSGATDFAVGFPTLHGVQFLKAFMEFGAQIGKLVRDMGESSGHARFQIQVEPMMVLLMHVLKSNKHTAKALASWEGYSAERPLEEQYNEVRRLVYTHLLSRRTKKIDLVAFIPPLYNQAILAISRLQANLEYAVSAVVGELAFTVQDWLAKPAGGTMESGFVMRDGKVRVLYGLNEKGEEQISP